MGLFETFEKVSHQEWVDKINTDLKGKDYQETLVWASEEGIDIQPFYNDAVEVGNTPLKTTAAWKINETVVVEDIETANRQALEALKGGANSILFIGEINTPSDMDALLKDIQTAIVELHFYAPNPKEVSSFIALAQGSISYDLIDNKTTSWLNDLTMLTQSDAKFKTITVQPNTNNSIIEELASALSKGVEYLNLLTDKGVDPQKIAAKMQFSLGVNTNYFFEIAKLRAARRLWQFILEQYKVNDVAMTILSETTLTTTNQEDKNYDILRNTTKAMAAVIGGCDSLSIHPHDTENLTFANRIARNIQHILKEEAFLDKVTNPADGSYYIEHLTNEIAHKTWGCFKKMESDGSN